jgi:MSHA biogenesis protein MshJ
MMATLRQRWRQWSALYAARVVRERLLLAATGVAVVFAGFQLLVLDPLNAERRRLEQQITAARNAIKAGDAVLASRSVTDPDEVRRRYRDALRTQLTGIDRQLQNLQQKLVPPEQVSKLLDGVLSRNRGLALVSLRKLPVQRFQTTATAAQPTDSKAPADAAAAGAADHSIYQHSFELAVEGSYNDLHSFLTKLEGLQWQLFWGKLELDASAHPRIRLTLTVHTLSLNRTWLIV